MNSGKKDLFRRLMVQVVFIAAIYLVLSVLMAVGIINEYVGTILTTASIYVIVAIGLNLVTGMTGQLVLGTAGFLAVGAYSSAILLKAGFPLLPALLSAAFITALIGLIIGVLAFRLRGDYLAIVTLGFGEIIRVVLMNLDSLTGGATGMMGIGGIFEKSFFGMILKASLSAQGLAGSALNSKFMEIAKPIAPTFSFIYVSLFMVLAILAMVHLLTSSHGRAILSVRDDEIASESMGVCTYYTKLYSFVVYTFLAGLAGGLFASHYKYLNPSMFDFLKSMDFLIIVVFGGLGSLTGTVAASFVIALLTETLRNIPVMKLGGVDIDLKSLRFVIFPLLLILMMIFRPQGLLGTKEFRLTQTFERLRARLTKGGANG